MKQTLLGLIMAFCPTMASNAQVIDTVLNKVSQQPFNFSVAVPDGNYRVTVTLGNKKKPDKQWYAQNQEDTTWMKS